jgi:hypothetical protein
MHHPTNHITAIRVLIAAAFLMLVSCKKTVVHSPEELTAFVGDEENGCIQKSVTGKTVISVTYRPTDLIVHQEIGEEPVEKKIIDSLRNKYSKYYYFILSLSHDDKEALHQVGDQYSDMVNTLSFHMSEFVTMTTAASDTIPVGDFMLNRTFGMSASTDLLFVFNREKSKDKDWVQFNLNEFGLGVGNQRFRFKTKDLEEVPTIDFKMK